jgi:hypothetical protein
VVVFDDQQVRRTAMTNLTETNWKLKHASRFRCDHSVEAVRVHGPMRNSQLVEQIAVRGDRRISSQGNRNR